MNSKQRRQLEACVKGPEYQTDPTRDQQVLKALLRDYQEKHQETKHIGRWTMLQRKYHIKTVAAAIVALIVVGGLWLGSPNKVWALEQVLTALEEVRSIHVQGGLLYGRDREPMPFDLWVQAPGENGEPMRLRFECAKRIFVVEGDRAYVYWPKEGVAKVQYGPNIKDFKFLYDVATYSPWFTSKLLTAMRHVFTDWVQSVDIDPVSGREEILVSCRYLPDNIALRMIADSETKLITEIRIWEYPPAGEPEVHANLFTYNEDIPPGTFSLPEDTRITDMVAEQEAQALFDRGEHLFHEERQYERAMEVYQQVCDSYPEQKRVVGLAMTMIGICYNWLGEHDKEIAAYKKAVAYEEAASKGLAGGGSYYYLGLAYMQQGSNAEALDVFEKCVRACQGHRSPDQFPHKSALVWIQQLKKPDFELGSYLFDRGEQFFHKDKDYERALQAYRRAYESLKSSDAKLAHNALMMIGLCHGKLKQNDQAIEVYEEAIAEYADLKGWVESTYFYLGAAYEERGDTARALEVYQKCLEAGKGRRRADQFPIKEAQERISQLQEQ